MHECVLPLQMEIMTEDYYRQVEEVSKTQEKLTKCEEQLILAEVNFVKFQLYLIITGLVQTSKCP